MPDIDMTVKYTPPPPEGIYGLLLYREMGYYLKRKDMFGQSVNCFNKALSIKTDDLRTLNGRSKVNSAATDYMNAMKDAETALSIDKNDLIAALQRAQAKYELGDFEEALTLYYKGWYCRKQPPDFEEGTHTCAETLEDCIGCNVGSVLKDLEPTIIRKINFEKAEAIRIANLPECPSGVEETEEELQARLEKIVSTLAADSILLHDILVMRQDRLTNPREKLHLEILGRVLAETYLWRLAHDKKYVKQLREDPRLQSANASGVHALKQLADEAYKTLCNRQEVLRTRRPYYCIEYRRMATSEILRRKQQADFERRRNLLTKNIENQLEQVRQARIANDLKTLLLLIDKAKTFCDKKPYNVMPRKDSYLNTMYNIAGLTYLQAITLPDGMPDIEIERRIKGLFGVQVSREPSGDILIPPAAPFVDYSRAMKIADDRAKNGISLLENTFYYHEMARLNLEVWKFDKAKEFAQKALNSAKSDGNHAWVVNAALLAARAFLMSQQLGDAQSMLKIGLKSAEILRNSAVMNCLDKCLKCIETFDLDELIVDDEGIQKREKEIMSVMTGTMKKDAEFLFRRMSEVIPERRLSIVPGVQPKDRKGKKGKKKSIRSK